MAATRISINCQFRGKGDKEDKGDWGDKEDKEDKEDKGDKGDEEPLVPRFYLGMQIARLCRAGREHAGSRAQEAEPPLRHSQAEPGNEWYEVSTAHTPQSKIQNPKSKIQNPKSKILLT
ncbi:hypothetical protein F7734_55225 [Scytonema sp. UIC 10036]|nr:hypothetical protein [Scytonema sp. UIC 10036]